MSVYRRSPNLLVEWRGTDVIVVDCAAWRRFQVSRRVLDVLAALDSWKSADALAADVATNEASLDRLVGAGMLQRREDGAKEDGDGDLRLWTPFELAVHRMGSVGGYRGDDELQHLGAPPPVRHPRPDGAVTVLPEAEHALAMTLADSLTRRRSIRTYADRPVTLEQISTLLHHAARVIRAGHDDMLGGEALHPYPTGGARSELDVYAIANDVEVLDAGAYYFDAFEHELVRLDAADEGRQRLVRSVHAATDGRLNRDPPLVLVITAVFARVMWKYRDIGLITIYTDVGCLLQSLYLVATAMELAPCAIGGGEELATSRWLGLDPLVEAQVGCLVVGVPRAG